MRDIQKSDIIGARIVKIHETYELTKDGLDCRQIYFTVDRGFTFTTPYAGIRWNAVKVPDNAKRLTQSRIAWLFPKKDVIGLIKQRHIAGIYCGLFNEKLGFHYPNDGTIVFEDGSQAVNTVVAPHGTGGAGLYFFLTDSGRCTPRDELVDYFSIPLDKPET